MPQDRRSSPAQCVWPLLVALAVVSVSGERDQRLNKYVFSSGACRDSLFLIDSIAPFFSLHHNNTPSPTYSYFRFKTNKNHLDIGNDVLLALQSSSKGTVGHALAAGRLWYSSSALDGHIHIQANTIARIDTSAYIKEVALERSISGMRHITGFSGYDFLMREAYFSLKWNDCRLHIGKKKMRWGPGYKGTLGWSGVTVSPYSLYQLYIPFGNRFRYSSFFHGYDDINTSDVPRFGAGQRIDIRICEHLDFGMYELAVFHGMQDFAQYFVPLQLYYLGSNAGDNAPENLLGGADVNIYLRPFRLYAEFINDDITVFDKSGNPNKYAFQVGSSWHSMKLLRRVGIEYTHVSRYIYGHEDLMNQHTYYEDPLGWPWGNDQDVFNVHAIFRPSGSLSSRAEITYWILGQGRIEDSWTADGRPDMDDAPYWPQHTDRVVSLLSSLHYSPLDWIQCSFYLRPAWTNGSPNHSLSLFLRLWVPQRKGL